MIFLEYLSSNELIKYPFKDDATMGTLPLNFILDAVIYGEEGDLFINKIDNEYVYIARAPDEYLFKIRIPLINRSISTYNNKARILFGEIVSLYDTYSYEETAFLDCICVPEISRVLSIGIESRQGNPLTGNVLLNSNDKMTALKLENNIITLDINKVKKDTKCNAICKINNQKPTNNNINVAGSTCINVYKEPHLNMVAIRDECHACCENKEERLSNIEIDLLDIDDELASLDDRVTALENA